MCSDNLYFIQIVIHSDSECEYTYLLIQLHGDS